MTSAARLSFSEMTALMDKMPCYDRYRSDLQATEAERSFRRALGVQLKECGDHLLAVADQQSQSLGAEDERMIDALIERIGMIFRRLDREGDVCLVGHCDNTIHELEELDARLILLIENATGMVRRLETGAAANRWFQTEAHHLSRDLSSFGEMAEERNYLLGLGWESEFAWSGKDAS